MPELVLNGYVYSTASTFKLEKQNGTYLKDENSTNILLMNLLNQRIKKFRREKFKR